jgi:hypothetical protein
VVEVQVRRDNRRDVLDAHPVAVKCLAEVVVHRAVELIDELVAHSHSRIDENRAGRVNDEIREHRERWPGPRQVRSGCDVRQVKPVNVDGQSIEEPVGHHTSVTHERATLPKPRRISIRSTPVPDRRLEAAP